MSLPIFSVFFRFLPFPFFPSWLFLGVRFFRLFSVFFFFFSVFFRFIFQKKKRGDTVRETLFAKPKAEVKLRLKWGSGICSPDQSRTTVWKPPFTDPRFACLLTGSEQLSKSVCSMLVKLRLGEANLKLFFGWELRHIYHHHPESKKRKSPSEANPGSILPHGRYGNAVKQESHIYHSDSLACQGHF